MIMKKLFMIIFSLLAIGVSACSQDNEPTPKQKEQSKPDPDQEQPSENNDNMKLQLTISSDIFTATLLDNATAKAFGAMLPMTVDMSEHASNEKYYSLPSSLPTAGFNPGTISNGDIMLFGASTLVIFYKTFATSYSYTRIGKVDDPQGLEKALGAGSVTVTLEIVE